MARIRSIKPELRTSITVSAWPREVRYFFVLLWGYLDDYGRGVDDEMLIASDCFPRDRDVTPELVDEWLEAMADSGPLCRYEVDGRRYLHAPNWGEHQKPAHPTRSKVPPCPDDEPDQHKEWREKNPQRLVKRSRKSHENLAKIPPAPSGASGASSGTPPRAAQDEPGSPHPAGDSPESDTAATESESAGQSPDDPPHEILANSSRTSPENFAPEQGSKGARELGSKGERARGRASEDAPSGAGASLAPLATPIDIAALDDEIADELSQRTGLDITPPYVGWVREKLLADAPEVIGNVSLWVRGQIRSAEDIRIFLTPNMAAAYTARRRPTVVATAPNAARNKPVSVPLPDDFRLSDSMRRWAVSTFPAVDVDYETAQFVSHHRSRATSSASWPDEWQKWVRRAHKYATEQAARRPARAVNSPMPQAAAGNARALTAADRRLASNLDAVAWAAEQDRLEALQKGNPL